MAKGLVVRGLSETDALQNTVDLKHENKDVSFETHVNNFETDLKASENYLQNTPSWIGLREYPSMENYIEITTENPITQKETGSDIVEKKIRMKEKQINQKKSKIVRLESFYELEDTNGVMVACWAEKKLPGLAFCKICDSNVKFANGGRDLTNHSSTEKHKIIAMHLDKNITL